MTQPRKPRPILGAPGDHLYAGIEPTYLGHPIYIGGDYYDSTAQIHLQAHEAERLGKWLIKAAEYLKQKGKNP